MGVVISVCYCTYIVLPNIINLNYVDGVSITQFKHADLSNCWGPCKSSTYHKANWARIIFCVFSVTSKVYTLCWSQNTE